MRVFRLIINQHELIKLLQCFCLLFQTFIVFLNLFFYCKHQNIILKLIYCHFYVWTKVKGGNFWGWYFIGSLWNHIFSTKIWTPQTFIHIPKHCLWPWLEKLGMSFFFRSSNAWQVYLVYFYIWPPTVTSSRIIDP